jgi:hypothetical protein
MKKQLIKTFIILLAFTSRAIAQPTLTASDQNPVPGEQFRMANPDYIPPGPAGANQIWNLSSAYASQYSIINYTTTSSTPYASLFPDANISSKDGGTYEYYKTSSAGFQYYGKGDQLNGNTILTNPSDECHYPFNYNDFYTDTWSSTGPANYSANGTYTVTYDGYGSLIVPKWISTTQTTTLTNVARIHLHSEYTETFNSTTSSNSYDSYTWRINGVHYPVAITYTVSGPQGYQATFYMINIGFAGIPEYHDLLATIYPNPASDRLYFRTTDNIDIKTIELYDLTGKLYVSKTIENINPDTYLDVSALAPGMYFVKFITKDGVSGTKKILIN